MADNANTSIALLPDHESLAKDPKAVENFLPDTEELLNRIAADRKSGLGGLEEATEEILILEKKARQACDAISVSRLTCRLLELLREDQKWAGINEFVAALCKKRGQLKRAIIDMVRLCMTWIDETPDEATRKSLISALTTIADGKMFIEVEMARLVRIQAEAFEKEGNIDEAAKLLQEVQVETFGAMDRREKSLYILDQMRLVLARKDFVRCQLISKKINEKLLEPEDFQDIKLRYYKYMMEYYLHEEDYLNMARVCHRCFETPISRESDDWKEYLASHVVFLIMAPHSSESTASMQTLKDKNMKFLEKVPAINSLVTSSLSTELIDWPLQHEQTIKTTFAAFTGGEYADRHWTRFRTRIMQHNILILSMYYTRITTKRASELLFINTDEVEVIISDLVTEEIIHARIDRPAGLITFGKSPSPALVLDKWSNDITQLLDLVHETCHLINNDRMVQAALKQKKSRLEKLNKM